LPSVVDRLISDLEEMIRTLRTYGNAKERRDALKKKTERVDDREPGGVPPDSMPPRNDR
jgi:hypothetical protein